MFLHDKFEVRFLLKITVFIGLVLSVYVLWPRQPSLTAFSPREFAVLNIASWRGVVEGRPTEALVSLYRIYEGQYGLLPIDALEAAWSSWQAMSIFVKAADRADQEQALPHLERAFGVLSSKAGMVGDSQVAARLELFEWMLASDSKKRPELATAVAEKIALAHGAPAAGFENAASILAKAISLRADQKWSAAERSLEQGLERVKERLPNPAKAH